MISPQEQLTPAALRDREDFRLRFPEPWDKYCIFDRAWLTHPGNPVVQQNKPECWEHPLVAAVRNVVEKRRQHAI